MPCRRVWLLGKGKDPMKPILEFESWELALIATVLIRTEFNQPAVELGKRLDEARKHSSGALALCQYPPQAPAPNGPPDTRVFRQGTRVRFLRVTTSDGTRRVTYGASGTVQSGPSDRGIYEVLFDGAKRKRVTAIHRELLEPI
jgi:hypothetical protein